MKFNKDKSVFVSLFIAIFIAGLVCLVWAYGSKFYFLAAELIVPKNSIFRWWDIPIITAFAVLTAYLAEKFSIKRMASFYMYFLTLFLLLNLVGAFLFDVSLLFIPVLLATVPVLAGVHLKKLWLIDSRLTERLVYLASTGHLLEGKSADLRIESGLKLLETVLPLSEVIVFRYTLDKELVPIGRSRNGKSECAADRQSSWRENIELCEKSLETRETAIQEDDAEKGAARVALPLIYEKVIVGVLFIHIVENFEKEDRHLLEAFSEQLARNFQRKELREKKLPHQNWSGSFSTFSAENRLDTISLIHGIIKEQSFSVIASSYLKEAHAIAYLDGTLAYLNRQMRHLADLNGQEFFETDIFKLLERFKTDVFNEPGLAIRRVLQTGDSYKRELFFPDTNRTLKMQISLVKVPSDSASIHETNVPLKPACFLITFSDISAVKENERLRSDMTSLMSHELRTPITSIQGFAELLLMDEDIPEESREFLNIIANESQRLTKMLATFLSVSNLEQSDKQEFSKSPVKLDNVVREVVGDMKETAKNKRIRLVEQANEQLPPIAADKGLITKAVTSLVDNAIKYSPERTSVIISTILESDFLRVVVEDRGYGIHPSEHEKIWQKFYRVARDGQDKEEESTGLGLSLVKEIVERHDGKVEVVSELGLGSKFSIKLPRL